MANPVNWFHISAKDIDAQHSFYGKIFTWKTSPGPGGMVFVAKEPGGINGGIDKAHDGHASISIYVGVDNLEEQLKLIEEHGGKPAMPPMDLPPGMGRIASFLDPEGNHVGIWQGAPQPEPEPEAAPKRRAAAKRSAKKAAPKRAAAKKAAPKKAAKKTTAKKKAAPKKAARR